MIKRKTTSPTDGTRIENVTVAAMVADTEITTVDAATAERPAKPEADEAHLM